MSRLAYVDSRKAVELAQRTIAPELVTDISPLAAHPSLRGVVTDLERLMSQDEANAIGAFAISLALEMDAVVRAGALPAALGLDPDFVRMGGGTSRLTSGILHRARTMSRALAQRDVTDVDLYVLNTPYVAPLAGPIPTRFGCPFPTLAEKGFFGSRTVRHVPYDMPLPFEGKPDSSVGGLRRLAHLPLLSLVYEVASRIGLDRLGHTDLVVGSENEALREALPWLKLFGFRIIRAGKLTSVSSEKGTAVDEALVIAAQDQLAEWSQPRIQQVLQFTEDEARALAHGIAEATIKGIVASAHRLPGMRRRIDEVFGRRGRKLFLTNGLFGLDGAQMFALLRKRGVTVVDFEHGVTTGLSAHSQKKIAFSEAATSDVLLVCSENAKLAFQEAGRGNSLQIMVTGLSDQTRRLYRPQLQRWLARKALGLRSAEKSVVMHVSTWPHSGNMRPGFGTPLESLVVDLRKVLIEDVYSKLDTPVVFKDYPTRRFIDEPQPQELFEVGGNIIFPSFEDLRYLRAAADVLVTASPTSTLGWVLGSHKPTIWLASRRINPLLGEAQDALFADALISVDVDAPGWADELLGVLSMPLSRLQVIWGSKREDRETLLKGFVFGERRCSGLAGARAVRDLAKGMAS